MTCVDISGDGCALLAVGLDGHGRQQVALWDISDVFSARRAPVLLKSTTDYNVKRARFSPYESNRFVTVGRDSIRLYRVKNGQLRGLSIQVRAATVHQKGLNLVSVQVYCVARYKTEVDVMRCR